MRVPRPSLRTIAVPGGGHSGRRRRSKLRSASVSRSKPITVQRRHSATPARGDQLPSIGRTSPSARPPGSAPASLASPLKPKAPPPSWNGYVEADYIYAAAASAGTIKSIAVSEGQRNPGPFWILLESLCRVWKCAWM